MDAEDLKLLRDIALIDLQLKIGASDAEKNDQGTSTTYTNLTSVVKEPHPSSAIDFSTPKEFNNSCQEILRQIEKKLLELLQDNREKQSILLNYLNDSGKNSDSCDNSIWKIIKRAGIPYFKDLHGYPQPRNDDVGEKLANGQLCCIDYLTLPHIWSQHHKNSLRKAVLGNYHSINYEPSNENDLKDTEKREKTGNKRLPIDWLKISAMDFNGKYSAAECESQWKLHLAPEVNKGKWSENEIEKLNTLAEKYKYQDWDSIALELGTSRTGYQCCIQFQTKNSLNEGKWSPAEDAYLEKLVQKFTRRNHVPWTKVSWYFQTRSRKQCQERYLEHLKSDLKKGHFSDAEDKIIISGVKIFKDFGKIARFLPGRAPTQIRSRYYYLISTSMSEFTKEEDDLLVSLAKQHPKNWLKISENFQNRSKLQCRKRYGTLCKQEQQDGELITEGEESCSDSKDTVKGKIISEKRTKEKNKRKKQMKAKEDDDIFSEIVRYHESCSENYFGPRIRNASEEELKEICLKLRATMAMLSVSCDFSDKSNLINLVKHNSNFDPYDIKILNELMEKDKINGSSLKDNYFLNRLIIPPNYNTLLGLNSLIANRAKIKCKTSENEGLPEAVFTTQDYKSDDRISFSRAKTLFRSRLQSLFYLPWMLTLIPTSEINWDVFHKAKRKKPKQLTRKRLKNHAKNMSFAYHQKRKRQKEAEESQKELSETENNRDTVKRFKSSIREYTSDDASGRW